MKSTSVLPLTQFEFSKLLWYRYSVNPCKFKFWIFIFLLPNPDSHSHNNHQKENKINKIERKEIPNCPKTFQLIEVNTKLKWSFPQKLELIFWMQGWLKIHKYVMIHKIIMTQNKKKQLVLYFHLILAWWVFVLVGFFLSFCVLLFYFPLFLQVLLLY